jgi:hypothetical protein
MRVSEALNERGRAVKGRAFCAGLAYKKDVDDVRESPSVTLIELLRARGAIVDYHDPHIPSAKPMREHNITDMRSVPLTRANLKKYDCVLISTDHSSVDYDMVSSTRAWWSTRAMPRATRSGRPARSESVSGDWRAAVVAQKKRPSQPREPCRMVTTLFSAGSFAPQRCTQNGARGSDLAARIAQAHYLRQ